MFTRQRKASPNPFIGAYARGVVCACRRAMQSINRLCSLQLQKNLFHCACATAQSMIRGENGLGERLPFARSNPCREKTMARRRPIGLKDRQRVLELANQGLSTGQIALRMGI